MDDRTAARVRRLRTAVSRRLGIDARALAAFRVSLGLLLLADLAIRATDLVAFYTDAGVLPRAALAEQYPALARVSIHAQFGSTWAQVALFLLAGVAAVALVVGYRTTLVTVVSWVLLVSLQARNPVLLNAGDSLLRRLLFWGLFLPLGARWSIDGLRPPKPGDDRADDTRSSEVVSVTTAVLLLQVVLVYTVNAAFKLRGDAWLSGVGILYVFEFDQLTVRLGEVLAHYPTVLQVLGRAWFVLVCSSVLLVLLTGRRRTVLVVVFAAMHLGMALTLRLGVFPLVSVAALLPFLPGRVWNRIEATVPESVPGREWVRRLPAGPSVDARWVRERVVPAVVAVLFAAVLVWNAATLGLVATPDSMDGPVQEYRWDMFSNPRGADGWYVVPGRLESGREVDAFRGGRVTWAEPPDVDASYPSHRWYLYLLDLSRPGYADLRPHLADYLCRQWNATHEDDLVSVSLYYVKQPVRLHAPDPTERRALGRYRCGEV